MTNGWIKASTTMFDPKEVVALNLNRANYEGEQTLVLTIYLRGGSQIVLRDADANDVWGKFNEVPPQGDYVSR